MNQEKIKAVLRRAIETHGPLSQIEMAIEELSELQIAVLNNLFEYDQGARDAAIIEEAADVKIMIAQLRIIFDCPLEQDKYVERNEKANPVYSFYARSRYLADLIFRLQKYKRGAKDEAGEQKLLAKVRRAIADADFFLDKEIYLIYDREKIVEAERFKIERLEGRLNKRAEAKP